MSRILLDWQPPLTGRTILGFEIWQAQEPITLSTPPTYNWLANKSASDRSMAIDNPEDGVWLFRGHVLFDRSDGGPEKSVYVDARVEVRTSPPAPALEAPPMASFSARYEL